MGRVERRKKLTMTEEELETVVNMEIARYSRFYDDAVFCALGVALHDTYGFGHDRILRLLKHIYTLLEGIGEHPQLLDELKRDFEKDLGFNLADREWEK